MFPKKGRKKLLEPRRPLRRFKKKYRYHNRQCLMFPIFSNRNILFQKKKLVWTRILQIRDPELESLDSRQEQLIKSKRSNSSWRTLFLTLIPEAAGSNIRSGVGQVLIVQEVQQTLEAGLDGALDDSQGPRLQIV
jgi:hypothetical protein